MIVAQWPLPYRFTFARGESGSPRRGSPCRWIWAFCCFGDGALDPGWLPGIIEYFCPESWPKPKFIRDPKIYCPNLALPLTRAQTAWDQWVYGSMRQRYLLRNANHVFDAYSITMQARKAFRSLFKHEASKDSEKIKIVWLQIATVKNISLVKTAPRSMSVTDSNSPEIVNAHFSLN